MGKYVFYTACLMLLHFLNTGRCARCGDNVLGDGSGCVAMEQVFHVECFTCITCHAQLRGKPFYALDKKSYCESCYIVSFSFLFFTFPQEVFGGQFQSWVILNVSVLFFIFDYRVLWSAAQSVQTLSWIESYEQWERHIILAVLTVQSVAAASMVFPSQWMPPHRSTASRTFTGWCYITGI